MKRSLKASVSTNPETDWLEALPLAALLLDDTLCVTSANSAAQELAAALRGLQLKETFGELHPLTMALTRALHEGRTSRLNAIELNKTLQVSAWVSPYGQGQALLLLDPVHAKDTASFTQISSTMAAMLAHEIRNPLLSIKGASQLLQQAAAKDDVALCQLIGKEVDRIEQLIATLDPLSITPPTTFTALNIHEVLEHARLATAAAFPALTFVIDYDPSLPQVMGNRDALVQALLNLLKNAAEAASMEQPVVTLSSRYVLGETRRNAAGKNLPIALSIADNGAGIDPAIRDRLFAPFTTNKVSGKGLGLAVVARIIEEHEGLAVAETASAGGARFTLYLPIASFPDSPA